MQLGPNVLIEDLYGSTMSSLTAFIKARCHSVIIYFIRIAWRSYVFSSASHTCRLCIDLKNNHLQILPGENTSKNVFSLSLKTPLIKGPYWTENLPDLCQMFCQQGCALFCLSRAFSIEELYVQEHMDTSQGVTYSSGVSQTKPLGGEETFNRLNEAIESRLVLTSNVLCPTFSSCRWRSLKGIFISFCSIIMDLPGPRNMKEEQAWMQCHPRVACSWDKEEMVEMKNVLLRRGDRWLQPRRGKPFILPFDTWYFSLYLLAIRHVICNHNMSFHCLGKPQQAAMFLKLEGKMFFYLFACVNDVLLTSESWMLDRGRADSRHPDMLCGIIVSTHTHLFSPSAMMVLMVSFSLWKNWTVRENAWLSWVHFRRDRCREAPIRHQWTRDMTPPHLQLDNGHCSNSHNLNVV